MKDNAAAPQPPTVSDEKGDLLKPGWLAKDVKRAVRRCEELDLAERQVTHPAQPQDESFQSRVKPWMLACFGAEIAADRLERSDRFIEEALELVQASGYTKDRAHQLVEYVFGRDQGEINQEVGGVMVTLAAHCLAHGVDMHAAAEKELARVWTKVDVIRAKQASKPKGSALPVPVNSPDLSTLTRERDQAREALAENQSDVSSFLADYERGPGYISVPTHRLERLDRINRSVLHPEKEEKA